MEGELYLPENKLRDFIKDSDKGKWRCDNNHNIKYFTEDEIKSITSNYNSKIGCGAFGEVYRGVLGDGRSVAVKRYIRVNTEEEFAKEVIVHSQINHKNVVRLIGCCTEKNGQMMVFEHASNGNLNDRLHSGDAIMCLDTRLNIALECAEALCSMHSMYRPVLHGDIKPANILLDENFHAKVSDFGISRLLSGNDTDWTRNVIGSIGYMDPAICKDGRLTPKSDVYSLGVVLVELITKADPKDTEKKIVERFAQFSVKDKGVKKLFDADIANVSSMKVLEGIGKIARECLKENIDERPEMKDVVVRLRELRTTLEQAKEKAGRLLISQGQSANNVASRSALNLIRSLGVFNRNAPNINKNIINRIDLQCIKNITVFRKKELNHMTQNFSTLIGRGAYVNVYLGVLDDNTRVAVKRSIKTNLCEDVINELHINSQSYHSNIIKLVGCCLEMDDLILVYEYMSNGSLNKYLFLNKENGGDSRADRHDDPQMLDLNTRYQVALGVAHAMAYLHEERQEWVLHCDIKPENILLDDHFRPKVSDFGLSKMMSKRDEVPVSSIREVSDFGLSKLTSKCDTRMTMSCIRGTRGYMAPEWVIHREPITAKADVYSFGMVLLEIISGRRNYGFLQDSVGSEDWYFPAWAYEKVYVEHRIDDILDPRFADSFDPRIDSVATVERMVKTAMWCLQYRAEMRPSMGKVAKMLEGSVEITEPVKPNGDCWEFD